MMADTSTKGETPRNLSAVNPLIGENGDTAPVQFVLSFLSFTMQEATDGQLALSPNDSLGLSFILDACRAALANANVSEVAA